MAYDANAQKKYRNKSITVSVCYRPTDKNEGQRLKAYLAKTNQNANSYIKGLIKADLDSKGIAYTDSTDTE